MTGFHGWWVVELVSWMGDWVGGGFGWVARETWMRHGCVDEWVNEGWGD